MSSLRASLLALLTSALWTGSAGGGFLMRTVDVDNTLEKELNGFMASGGAKKVRLDDFKRALLPFFTALPKNAAGNLEHQTARYILHRLFVHRHGWYIKGLEPDGDMFQAAAGSRTLMRLEWVPAHLLEHLEQLSEHRGLDLNDLAAVAAALEDVVQQEARDLMAGIYLQLNITARSPKTVQEAVRLYLTSFLSSKVWDAKAAQAKQAWFISQYTDWNVTQTWFQAIEQEHLGTKDKKGGYDAEVASEIAIDIGARYGAFNDRQCSELKAAFMGTWAKARTTGRIRLADFYRLGMDSQWDFVESRDYLRSLGALDESNQSSPLVILPNYLTARPNCMDATSLYEVCCRNECEDLMVHLERSIAAPAASPERIIELVSALDSDTVAAPRHLDATLVRRLWEIADRHGGQVKLHGRLFSQWMHHVYPNECPYPHEAGAADPASPDEWMGADIAASEEERMTIVAESCAPEEAAEWTVDLPWSHTEELLPHHMPPALSASRGWARLGLAVLAAGAVVAMALLRERAAVQSVPAKQVLLSVLALVAVATNMVNPVLLVVMLGLGLLMHRALAAGETASRLAHKVVQRSVV